MKTLFKMEGLEINGVKLGNMVVEQEYTAKEAVELIAYGKQFMNEIVEELPEFLSALQVGYDKFNSIDERVCKNEKLARMKNQEYLSYFEYRLGKCNTLSAVDSLAMEYAHSDVESYDFETKIHLKRYELFNELEEKSARG